MYRGTFGNAVR
jgi:hypothetical protein